MQENYICTKTLPVCYTYTMKMSALFAGLKRTSPEEFNPANAVKGGIFLPSDRKIGSCMTHRPDIVWIDAASNGETIRRVMAANPGFTQFPVCSGSVDKVLGTVSVRHFLETLLEPSWPGLREIVKKPVFLSETVTILKALQALDEAQSRMAFIIDEYGGIEGIVTRNGLVGELLEETRVTVETAEDRGGRYIDGQTRMEEILESYDLEGIEEDSGEYYTLAGYLLTANGSIPKAGDAIMAGGYRWEVVEMDGNRINKVRVNGQGGDRGSGI